MPVSSDSSMRAAEDSKSTAPDVFLSYHGDDVDSISAIRRALQSHGIEAFVDRERLVVGLPWPDALEKALRSVRAVLVFIGDKADGDGLGLWQKREMWFALDRQVNEERLGQAFPVIPVLLPGARIQTSFLFANTWVDLRGGLDDAEGIDSLIQAIRGDPDTGDAAYTTNVCPYRALEVFREEDAPIFFGREATVEMLVSLVESQPLVTVVGPSGSGKSSVVQAGLLPMLRRQRPPQPAWDVAVFKPGERPFYRLAAALLPLLEPTLSEIDRLTECRKLGARLAEGELAIEDVVERLLEKSRGTDRLLIVADQFEELFTLAAAEERAPFAAACVKALDKTGLTFVFTLRADFYGQAIALDRGLSDRIQAGIINLSQMTRDELHRAIESPAQKVGLRFESGLVDRILDHVEDQPGSLPLLEFALTQLWERREGVTIRHAEYEAIGEVEGAISKRAEGVFQSLPSERQELALRLFARLLRVTAANEEGSDTRQRISLSALDNIDRAVLTPFVDARLVVLDRKTTTGEETAEVAHEALLRSWRRLGEWVDSQREFLLWRQRFGLLLAEWQRTGRNKAALLRGPSLTEARHWRRKQGRGLNSAEQEFIKKGVRVERRGKGIRNILLGLVLVIVAIYTGIQFWLDSDDFRTRVLLYTAPMFLSDVSPSTSTVWFHGVEVAGETHKLDDEWVTIAGAGYRLRAYLLASMFFSEKGATKQASALADSALKTAKDVTDFESNVEALVMMAITLHSVGRHEESREFARKAFESARAITRPDSRAAAISRVSPVLARVGMTAETEAAVSEALSAEPDIRESRARDFLNGYVAAALLRLGRFEQSMGILRRTQYQPIRPIATQILVDLDRLDEALSYAKESGDGYSMVIVASALATAGDIARAKLAVTDSLLLMARDRVSTPLVSRVKERLLRQVLLKIVSPGEAQALVGEVRDLDATALLAVVLAQEGERNFAETAAEEAVRVARQNPDTIARAQALSSVVRYLSLIGDTDAALALAREIETDDFGMLALGHVAQALASAGETERAESLIEEIDQTIPKITAPGYQSLAWAGVARAKASLGDYAAAMKAENIRALPEDRIAVFAAILREIAVKDHPRLAMQFADSPAPGLGKYGVHWP